MTTQPLFELQTEEILVKEELERALVDNSLSPAEQMMLRSMIRMIELFQEVDDQE